MATRDEEGGDGRDGGEPSDLAFLTLRFDGGRFLTHGMPVDSLVELATIERVLERVAKRLYMEEHYERRRIPKGFPKASRLALVDTEHNCWTATLARPFDWPHGDAHVFDQAKDIVMSALRSAAADEPIVDLLGDEIDALRRLGSTLREDEHLVLDPAAEAPATVNVLVRARLAAEKDPDFEYEIELDGELVRLDDLDKIFTVKMTDDRGTIDVWLKAEHRDEVTRAFRDRPATLVRISGTASFGQRAVTKIRDLEFFDHPRAEEIRKVWKRLESFADIAPGWYGPDARAISPRAIATARDAIGQMLAASKVPKPALYPRPDGNVQAEWVAGSFALEARFSTIDDVDVCTASAINADDGAEHDELQLDLKLPSALVGARLAAYFARFFPGGGSNVR